jgi:hypothetical protein
MYYEGGRNKHPSLDLSVTAALTNLLATTDH